LQASLEDCVRENKENSRRFHCIAAYVMAALVMAVGMLPSAFADTSSEPSQSRVLGVGRIQTVAVMSAESDLSSRLATGFGDSGSEASAVAQLATPVVKEVAEDIEPEDEYASDDDSGEAAVTLGPAPQADFANPDDNDGWLSCNATAYGPSNAGRWTATGDELTYDSVGVGTDISLRYLLGTRVEIRYGDKVMTCVINDVGYCLSAGRMFDLQPGVWRAFGFDDEFAWGVRTIEYRLLG
jgi:hypothetical protein